MKRTRLKPRSKSTEKWMKLYLAEKMRRNSDGQDCCQHCKSNCGWLQGHHYFTNRIGPNMLRFVVLGAGCHSRTNYTLRELGLLAEVNGTFSTFHPAVTWAEERYSQLMETLKQKER
jgi:hypothetical protein